MSKMGSVQPSEVQETTHEHSVSNSSEDEDSPKKKNASPLNKSIRNWNFKDTNEVWQDKNIWSFIDNHSVEGKRNIKLKKFEMFKRRMSSKIGDDLLGQSFGTIKERYNQTATDFNKQRFSKPQNNWIKTPVSDNEPVLLRKFREQQQNYK